MLDTIYIGTSGLTSYSEGLRTVSNNLTNVNTPGYKGANLQFANMFSQQSGLGGSTGGSSPSGGGLQALATAINFKQGDFQQTGNALDVAIDGKGFFVLSDNGQTRYTRDGQFQFDTDGFLTSRVDGSHVQSLSDKGQLADIKLSSIQNNAPKATTTVTFAGNLASDATNFTLSGVNVIDAVGGQHNLTLAFANNSGTWTVSVTDGSTAVGSGTIQFSSGQPVSGKNSFSLTYSPSGVASIPLKFDFSTNATSVASTDGSGTSTLSMTKQDDHVAGALTDVTFDDEGFISAKYSNGQTVKGARLALASFDSEVNIEQAGSNEFISNNPAAVHYGYAKTKSFGSLQTSVVEGSNVDMAQEFSNLIVMQRGYQASSHVVSVANDMIQELFDMKGHR